MPQGSKTAKPRLHDLRHSHASQLLKAGADIKVISAKLGHSGIAVTADTYLHLLSGMDAAAADKIDAALPLYPAQHRDELNVRTGGGNPPEQTPALAGHSSRDPNPFAYLSLEGFLHYNSRWLFRRRNLLA